MKTRELAVVAAMGLLVCALGVARAAEVRDDFSAGGWAIGPKDKAPGSVKTDKGKLVLTDFPGGKVRWGTMAAKRFRDIDLTRTPYFVVDAAKVENGFGVKLIGRRKGWKKTSVINGGAGVHVVDIPKATGWKSGVGDVTVAVYAHGDGTSIELRSLRFTSDLTDEEKKILAVAPTQRRALREVGLEALIERAAADAEQPAACDPADGERTVYIDPNTGHPVWRMTNHPCHERHEYYDVLCWNADGRTMMFLTRRGRGKGRYWLMDAKGTNIRPLEGPDGKPLKRPNWSPVDPDVQYYTQSDEARTVIVEYNLRGGKARTLASVPYGREYEGKHFGGFSPPHPDGRFFLMKWGKMDREPTMLVVVDGKTGEHKVVDLPYSTHRVRFSKRPDHSVFVNSNHLPGQYRGDKQNRREYVIGLDGASWQLPKKSIGHPDWSPGGEYYGGFADGGIWILPFGGEYRELVHTNAGGHGGFCLTTGKYHIGDAPRAGPYGDMVYVTEIATGKVTPLCYHGSSYSGWSSGNPDPESTHPAPICSPDETKVVYDSDMIGNADMWVVVWKLPAPPRDVALEGGTLRWRPGALSAETQGYNVYRKDGERWRTVEALVGATELGGLDAGAQYAVSVREWSGLESQYALAGGGLGHDETIPEAPGAPKVVKTAGDYIGLEWPAVDDAGLDHYNVYAAGGDDAEPSIETLVGSPSRARFVDWGLKAGETYHYRVTAVDRHGNESKASPPTAATTGTK